MTSAPFIWTKCLRCIVKFIRLQGIRFVLFLDDGWGVNKTFECTLKDADFVKDVLIKAGFLINTQKSILTPVQNLEWLGLLWNLKDNVLEIPDRRVKSVVQCITFIIGKFPFVSARDMARCTGKIISLIPVLGNVCKLMTKNLHRAIECRFSWNSVIDVSNLGVITELQFSEKAYTRRLTKKLFVSDISSVIIYSDASTRMRSLHTRLSDRRLP